MILDTNLEPFYNLTDVQCEWSVIEEGRDWWRREREQEMKRQTDSCDVHFPPQLCKGHGEDDKSCSEETCSAVSE